MTSASYENGIVIQIQVLKFYLGLRAKHGMKTRQQQNDYSLMEVVLPPDTVSIISLCPRSIVLGTGEAARFGVPNADGVGVFGS